jgi:phage portal protein BeeE
MAVTIRERIANWLAPVRSAYPAWNDPVDNFLNQVTMGGVTYGLRQTLTSTSEPIGADYLGLAQGGMKSNGVVFAAIQARLMLLSQARFQWQKMVKGVPGDLWGNADLALLEHPEPGRVTSDLLARASVDVDLAGNHFLARRVTADGVRLKRLEPYFVDIITGGKSIDAAVEGYIYYPGGRYSGETPEVLLPEEVAHLAPLPDPLHRYRGMSWITAIIADIQSDSAATAHKLRFIENGATVNLVVTIDQPTQELFDAAVAKFDASHKGLRNAFKTLFKTPATTVDAIGANLQEMEFSVQQGHAETRVAMASGIHPVILGASEGLQGSSLNQGNFMAARRLVADMTLRPWWGNFASSLEVVLPPPGGSRLWYDDRHIPFLAEDVKDAANVLQLNAQTMKALSDGGWEADSVVEAVTSGDLSRLKGKHTGLFSVQLNPPDSDEPDMNGQPPKDEANALVNLEG